MPRRILTGTFAFALVSVLLASQPSVSSGAPPTAVDESKLEYELSFRAKFGLSTDIAFVRQVMSQPDAYDSYDVALTDEEEGELQRRFFIERALPDVRDRAQALPGYAGLWIDQRAGGVVKVAFTKADAATTEQFADLLPKGTAAEIEVVAYGLPYLEKLGDELWADREELEAEGIVVRHLYPDIMQDRLIAGVAEPTAESLATLQSRYGPAIAVEASDPTPSSCTSRNHCIPPLRAGIQGSGGCSLAFLVHQGSNVNILTAGHCAQTLQVNWYHDGTYIGKVLQTGWPAAAHSEIARIGPVPASLVSDWIYYTTTQIVHVYDWLGYDEEFPGQTVCLSGRWGGNGYRCGILRSIGRMTYSGGVYFDSMRFADYAIKSGDSGGAIHTSYSPNFGAYTLGVQSGCTVGFDGSGNCLGLGVYSAFAWGMIEVGYGYPCATTSPC